MRRREGRGTCSRGAPGAWQMAQVAEVRSIRSEEAGGGGPPQAAPPVRAVVDEAARGQGHVQPGSARRVADGAGRGGPLDPGDRKSTRLNSSHLGISYAVFCL